MKNVDDLLKDFVDKGNALVGYPENIVGNFSLVYKGAGSKLVFKEGVELKNSLIKMSNSSYVEVGAN